jgi:hypothetical protein
MPSVHARARACLSLLAVAGVGAAIAAPPASADVPTRGYVWAYAPTAASYTVSGAYEFNSSGQANTITRTSVGRYIVSFPGLGDTSGIPGGGGTVDVTAYGAGTSSCEVEYWTQSGTTVNVHVLCTDLSGIPIDSMFDAVFTQMHGFDFAGSWGYLWASQPSTPSYDASVIYRYSNQARDLRNPDMAHVIRFSAGRYEVRLQGLGADVGGTVKVTAYGGQGNRCKVVGWGSTGGDILADVNCFSPLGASIDSYFTMTYAENDGLFLANRYAYAWASQPSTASYAPASPWHLPLDGGTQITRLGVGSYMVHFDGIGADADGDVQVSAYGSDTNECRVSFWTPDGTGQDVYVTCYTAAGVPADSYFTVQQLFGV